jgi:preflagellin peptidase FlaK
MEVVSEDGPVTEILPVLDLLRLLTAVLFLGLASLSDLRTRKVRDEVWKAMLTVALVILAIHILFYRDSPGPLYLLALLPPAAFMVPALVGMPELREMARGNAEDILWGALMAAGAIAFVAEFYLFSFTGYLWFSIRMVAMPALILIVYTMYMSGLIHGGADAKAIMVLAVLFPFYPDYTSFGIGPFFDRTFVMILMEVAFPFAVTILFNAVFAFIFVPFVFFFVNLSRGELSGARSFFGYKMDVDRLSRPDAFVWLLETPPRIMPGPGGKKIPGKSSVMALKNTDPASEVRWFRRSGMSRVWVTPKIPFIVPIFAGTVVGALAGNIFFQLFTVLLGS